MIVFSEKSQPNIDSLCSSRQCDQICLPLALQNTARCACAMGELDNLNGQTCKVPREYLIYSMENEIRSISMQSSSSTPWRPMTGLSKAIGIDFDYRDNKIIFTDIVDKKIAWFNVASENQVVEDLIKQNVSLAAGRQWVVQPEGVAYDWVSDTVYYTDNGLNQVVSYKISTRMRYLYYISFVYSSK